MYVLECGYSVLVALLGACVLPEYLACHTPTETLKQYPNAHCTFKLRALYIAISLRPHSTHFVDDRIPTETLLLPAPIRSLIALFVSLPTVPTHNGAYTSLLDQRSAIPDHGT